ncbi:MAG TPA: hypothetical protein VEL07_03225 [Planctomycetota bacterium]|nr:hypothetical protein [Planctomycetota bacterium]
MSGPDSVRTTASPIWWIAPLIVALVAATAWGMALWWLDTRPVPVVLANAMDRTIQGIRISRGGVALVESDAPLRPGGTMTATLRRRQVGEGVIITGTLDGGEAASWTTAATMPYRWIRAARFEFTDPGNVRTTLYDHVPAAAPAVAAPEPPPR